MDASREHGNLLQRLRERGVTVAIDDFGTGYSSLDYLRRFPSNRIKIAQNFVKNLETTPGDAKIIRATIGLARELNIEVIAEGVETHLQRDLLKEWGCTEVQGYLFASPLAVVDAENALRNGTLRPPLACGGEGNWGSDYKARSHSHPTRAQRTLYDPKSSSSRLFRTLKEGER